jgi:hypothetical protein
LYFMAITYYHASCRNAWQQTQCRGNRYLLQWFTTYCNEWCCCNRPESLTSSPTRTSSPTSTTSSATCLSPTTTPTAALHPHRLQHRMSS